MINSGKISIIIPVYNVKDYLAESIESVINQTYKNLEIIIINDGSNYEEEKICDKYSKIDSRIKLIKQKNMGLSTARNKGLECVTGKYIAFLDPDDIYLPEMIEKTYKALVQNNVDCVICNFSSQETTNKLEKNNINEKEKRLKLPSKTYNKKEILEKLVEGKVNSSVWNKLYKKDLWEDIRFPDGHVYEDVLVNFHILNKTTSCYVLDEILIIHRLHSNSITHTFSKDNINDLYKAHYNLERIVKSNIPKIFTEEQYNNVCKKTLLLFISQYMNNFKFSNKTKEQKILLKKYIAISMRKTQIKNFNTKEKIKYYMYKNCRHILIIISKVNNFRNYAIRRISKK